MTSRRRGLSGWVGSLKPWHQLLAFFGALAVAVTAFNYGVGWVGGIERHYGFLARWLGWAPRSFVQAEITAHKTEHTASEAKVLRRLDTVDLRLVYSEIRRLQREQERLRVLPGEKQRLEDVTTELADAVADYQAIKKKLKDGGGS